VVRRARGTEAVEVAMLLPLYLLITLAVFQFVYTLHARDYIAEAVFEAAKGGVVFGGGPAGAARRDLEEKLGRVFPQGSYTASAAADCRDFHIFVAGDVRIPNLLHALIPALPESWYIGRTSYMRLEGDRCSGP
jgi:hypothetical protein